MTTTTTPTDLSETAASNTNIDGANAAENCPPSDLNNDIRGLAAFLAIAYNRLTGHYASTGSANAYVLSPDDDLPAYVTGERYSFRANFANTGSASLNISSLGAKTIKKVGSSGKTNLVSGDIQDGQPVTVEYDGTDMVTVTPTATTVMLDGSGNLPAVDGSALTGVIPAGVLLAYGGSSAPTGWLLCDGSAVSRTTYADLFTAIGTAYGTGDGSTTFNVPDMRGRVPAGKDDMGGTAASRLTTAGSGVDGATLGAAGGAETHTLTTAEMPAHAHDVLFNTNAGGGGGHAEVSQSGTSQTAATVATGGGGAHNNTQPTLVTNYIIKT